MADLEIPVTIKDANKTELIAAARYHFGQYVDPATQAPRDRTVSELATLIKNIWIGWLRMIVHKYRVFKRDEENAVEFPDIGE